jgi:hypothetical protein
MDNGELKMDNEELRVYNGELKMDNEELRIYNGELKMDNEELRIYNGGLSNALNSKFSILNYYSLRRDLAGFASAARML